MPTNDNLLKVIEELIDLIDPGEAIGDCGADFVDMRASDENPDGCYSGNCGNWHRCCQAYHRHTKCEELREILRGGEDNVNS